MSEYVLEMRDIVKRYPGVLAVDHGQLTLRPGEVHCLVGENGAGKSTLMKVLAGAIPMDSGEIRLSGEPVSVTSLHHAQQLGISMIYQEFNLSPFLSVAENIFLGREPRLGKTPFINWSTMYRDAREILGRVRTDLDVRKPVNECSVAQQQIVEIAKALSFSSKVIVMDEPSATLTDHELKALFDLIRGLKKDGIGMIYISHRLEEIFEIGDRVTVMRDGQYIGTKEVSEVHREDLIHMMVGRELKDEYPKERFARGEEVLRVEGLGIDGAFQDVSFSLHKGEIMGLTGLVGAGRTEVARAIFGADKLHAGQIFLDGRPITVKLFREVTAGVPDTRPRMLIHVWGLPSWPKFCVVPYQTSIVGTSGAVGDRCGLVTPSARTVPAFACGHASVILSNARSICPPVRFCMISLDERYGTWVILVPVAILNSSAAR